MNSVSKNYIYNTCYTLLNILLPLITAPYLARKLGTEVCGSFAFYCSIAQWFALFAKLGLTNYGTRKLASVRDDLSKLRKSFSEIYVVQLCATIIVSIIYLGFVLFVAENALVAALLGIWVFSVLFDVDWFFFAIEEFRTAAIRSCIVKLLSTILIFMLVKSGSDLWKYALITALSYSIGFIYLWIKSYKYLTLSSINRKSVTKHIKPCLVLMIPVIALSIYRTMDKVMLGAMSSMHETGLYEYAEKLIYALCSFISSLGTVMMPRMSNLIAKKENKTSEIYIQRSMFFIMFLSVGMCFGLLSVSESLILTMYGEAFRGSVLLLNLLAITLVFIAWGNVIRTQYIIPHKRDKIYIGSVSLGAMSNLIVNAILIPRMGASGACIGTVVAEFVVPVFQFCILKKELAYKRFIKNAIMFIAFGTIMMIICRAIILCRGVGVITMMIQIVIGAAIYALLSFFYFRVSFGKKGYDFSR